MKVNKKKKALKVVDKKVIRDEELCVNCGGCVRACNLNAATSKEKGAEIFVGGRFGREMRLGDSLGRIFKEEEIIPVIDKIVEASKELGQTEERLSKTLDRIGAETFVNRVLEMVDGK